VGHCDDVSVVYLFLQTIRFYFIYLFAAISYVLTLSAPCSTQAVVNIQHWISTSIVNMITDVWLTDARVFNIGIYLF